MTIEGLDLACRAVGGSVVAASDESFGFKERLIDCAEPHFVPGTFDLRGEVVDGWETRRHAPQGDWAIIGLGVPGRLHTVDVDTRFFTGNHPTGATLYGATLAGSDDPCGAGVQWQALALPTALKGDAHNPIAVTDRRRYTHLKVVLASDGGVARLRAYGEPVPDPALWSGITVEVSGAEQGGRLEHCSDMFYSDARALISADRPHSMGAGWEARRRRDIGPDTHDAVTISFLIPADLDRVEIDTSYFVFNASREVPGPGIGPAHRGGTGPAPRPVGGSTVTPIIAQCAGLWRRTLLIEADGSRDTGTDVVWLQGLSLFVDLRGPGEGFAGQLDQRLDVFEWHRLVDLKPAGPPDAGRMSWAGKTLVEVGVHADYTEHWEREPGPAEPVWGLLVCAPDDGAGVLVRVGDRFGWAYQRAGIADVALGTVTGSAWRIEVSADPSRVGTSVNPRLESGQLRVDDDIDWEINESEGCVTL
ncbi:hypothetical protein [Mycolicibacterium sarraceniae]|uniref:Allantoicase domain-containing protein n=1 Tax=Mycolicibacterium sarraceniae TaxID=1534348 RepID=A0A7I7SVS8_9MYCO|nr:hypothetical protein [Mycolicibacterium sarraceniae]BBY60730.1 hypothetical protein MSAR_38660 [Mycolicibacterium sarraceniae]